MEPLTTPTKASVFCCQTCLLPHVTFHLTLSCNPNLVSPPPPHTQTSHLHPRFFFFFFTLKAWKELARRCLASLAKLWIRGRGFGRRGWGIMVKTFGRLWERRLVLESSGLRLSGGYDGLSLIAVCNNKLLDLERKFQTHPQPFFTQRCATPSLPTLPMPEKVYLSRGRFRAGSPLRVFPFSPYQPRTHPPSTISS